MSSTSQASPADISATQTEHEFCAHADQPLSADGRVFSRHIFRSCISAVVHAPPGDTLTGATGAGMPCQMLTRDISRGGLNLLHKQQLYPGQKIDVVLTDGQQRRLEVIWCRRLGVGCYSAGCRFMKAT